MKELFKKYSMICMADSEGSIVGNGGAEGGGPGNAEWRRRLVTMTAGSRSPPRLHKRSLTTSAVKEIFKEYSSYESE